MLRVNFNTSVLDISAIYNNLIVKMQYLDISRYGSAPEYPTIAPFVYGQQPLYNVCNNQADAIRAYEEYKRHTQMLVNDNPARNQTLARPLRQDYAEPAIQYVPISQPQD